MKRKPKRQKAQPGRNDPCSCGSGQKYKECCLAKHEAMPRYTREDRTSALEKLTRLVEARVERENDEAWDEFYEPILDLDGGEHEEYVDQVGEQTFDWWFWFDRQLGDGRLVVDVLLAGALPLSEGERRYLELARETQIRLYEVVETVPGKSVTLRDCVEGRRVTVTERLASRQLVRGSILATRVMAGHGDTPAVMDGGALGFGTFAGQSIIEKMREHWELFLAEESRKPKEVFFKGLAPGLFEVFAEQYSEPILSRIKTTDGEDMIWTTVHFDVSDSDALQRGLDSIPELHRSDEEEGDRAGAVKREGAGNTGAEGEGAGAGNVEAEGRRDGNVGAEAEGRGSANVEAEGRGDAEWFWYGINAQGAEITRGRLVLRQGALLVETNSKERGERARALVEAAAGQAVVYRATTHRDLTVDMKKELLSGNAPEIGAGPQAGAGLGPALSRLGESPGISAEIQEELVLVHLGQHYQRWVDEPVPALRDRTPRDAAKDPELRPEVEKLVRGLEGMYERALRSGQPAYDPSWMWQELGLVDPEPRAYPPPLAHERFGEAFPGFPDTCGKAAWALRSRPGFDEAGFVASQEDLDGDLDIRRLRAKEEAPRDLDEWLRYGVSFELHRRKVFWVDEALAFMLSHTDLDVDGGLLRAPFPALALVFTDRLTLSFAERLLAEDKTCPIRGHMLRSATVYVLEVEEGEARRLHLGFALDTGGEDPPHLVEHWIRTAPGERVTVDTTPLVELQGETQAEKEGSRPVPPLPGLLRITLNALLYASSPASEKVPRQSPPAPRRSGGAGVSPVFASDDVFYLPGTIPISQVRQLQRIHSMPSGRQLMTRFMVRGHWRRPVPSWADQRMRWIQPYWKGPDIAAVLERTYRLEP